MTFSHSFIRCLCGVFVCGTVFSGRVLYYGFQYVCVCLRECLRECVLACVRVCLRECVRECVRACVYACLRECVRACMRVCVTCTVQYTQNQITSCL